MKFKKFTIYFTAVLLCLSLAAPLVCSAADVHTKNDFVPSASYVIGWDGTAVTVNNDASFSDVDGTRVNFGIMPGVAEKAEGASEYPVYTYISETPEGLECTLTQFADTVSEDSDAVAVYTRFEVKNSGDAELPFPAVKGAVKLTDVPETVKAEERFVCDFVTLVSFIGERPSDGELTEGTFDGHMKHMKAHWDAVFEENSLFSSLPDAAKSFIEDYTNQIVYDEIGKSGGKVSESDMTTYQLCLLVNERVNDTEHEYDYSSIHDLLVTRLQVIADNVRQSPGGEYLYSEYSDPDYYSFDENIQALGTLSAGTRALALIARAENRLGSGIGNGDEYTDIRVALEKLSAGVSSVTERTVAALSCQWTAADTVSMRERGFEYYKALGADGDETLFELSADSASLLNKWYVESLSLGSARGGILSNLAKDAVDSSSFAGWDGSTFAAAVAFRDYSNVLTVGAGLSASVLAGSDGMTLKNIPGTNGASVTITTDENTIVFSLTGAEEYPVSIEIPMLRGNIKNASCDFDSEKGTVSAPAGTNEITVETSVSPADFAAELEADTALEGALLSAELRTTDGCTSISASRFAAALERAKSARDGSASVEEKLEAAEELSRAESRLSKTVAGYTARLTDGERRGYIKSNRVYQKFTVDSTGTIESIYVGGTVPEGTTAAVYTLKDDGYTPDEKLAEADGAADGRGVLFEIGMGFESEAGTEYVLCLTSSEVGSSDAMNLRVLSDTKSGTLYEQSEAATEAYRLCALDMTVSVSQADRRELDSLYKKCSDANVTGYTKESVKRLRSAMNDAAEALCTPAEEVSHCEEIYDSLHTAYVGLSTYASDEKPSDPPAMLYVLLGASAVLLCGALLIAASSGKKNAKG